MAILIGNREEPRSVSAKLYTWIMRLLILGFVCFVVFAVRNYSEDSNSHAIKVSFPLLLGYGQILYRPTDYDPSKAVWGPVHEAISVSDGQIIFVHTPHTIYSLKFLKQTVEPEQAEYEYVEVGSSTPSVKATTSTSSSGGVRLPDATLPWSGHELGKGFIYLKNPYVPGGKSTFEIGVPFYSGNLDSYSKAIPSDVHFESLPSKIGEAPDGF